MSVLVKGMEMPESVGSGFISHQNTALITKKRRTRMEALDFLKEAQRLCEQSRYCSMECPLYERCIFDFMYENESSKETWERIEKAVAIIEQWSKEHPIITNARKFEEVFGKQPKFWNGTYYCPPTITEDCCDSECKTCNKWWDKPYKEPEKGA